MGYCSKEIRLLLAASISSLALSCAPSDSVETVSFVLDLDSDRLSRISFVATPSSGRFTGSDGQCEIGNAAGPRAVAVGRAPSIAARREARTEGSQIVEPVTTTIVSSDSSKRGVVTTTTTTSSTSTTTTSTTSTSTSTTLPEYECRFITRLDSAVSVSSIQWKTDYKNAPGAFAGSGGDVVCTSLVTSALAAFNDEDLAKVLDSGLIRLDPFVGPTELTQCEFTAYAQPKPEDFVITNVEAAGADLVQILPPPTLSIDPIVCRGIPVTTTTTTTVGEVTTTTVDPGTGLCGNRVINTGEECDDGNVVSGDGCDRTCQAEYSFSAVVGGTGQVTISIVNGKGIPPGATLAFCRLQGEINEDDTVTTSCGLPDGTTCNPTTDAIVTVGVTTTTTQPIPDTTTTTEP